MHQEISTDIIIREVNTVLNKEIGNFDIDDNMHKSITGGHNNDMLMSILNIITVMIMNW